MKSSCCFLIFMVLVTSYAPAQTSVGVALTYNLPQGDFGDFARPAIGYELGGRRHLNRIFVDAALFYLNFPLRKTTFEYLNAPVGPADFTEVTLNKDWDFYGLTVGGGYYVFQKRKWAVYGGVGICYLYGFREVHEKTSFGNYTGTSSSVGGSGKFGVVPRLGATIPCGRLLILPEIRGNFNFSKGISAYNSFSDYDLGARDPFLQLALGIHYVLSTPVP